MTDREKAIVMAYTGICMLQGDKLNEFYKYLADLYGRPVYTHEIVDLDIAEKSKADFVRICHEEHPERKKGKWIEQDDSWDGVYYECSACGEPWTTIDGTPWDNGMNFCPKCGAEMTEESEEPKRCDTCKHEKEPWSMQCHRCEDYNLWEGKQ